MSNVLSIDAKQAGKLIINHGGEKFAIDGNGALTKFVDNAWTSVDASVTATEEAIKTAKAAVDAAEVGSEAAKTAATQLAEVTERRTAELAKEAAAKELKKAVSHTFINEVESNAKGLSDELKTAASKLVTDNHIAGLGAEEEVLKPVKKAVEAAKAINAAPANHKLTGKNLLNAPLAEDLLTTSETKALLDKGFDFSRMETFKSAKAELAGLLEPSKADPKKIREFLIANHDNIEHLEIGQKEVVALQKSGIKLDPVKLKAEVNKGVAEGVAAAKPEAQKIVRIAKDIAAENKLTKPNAKRLETLNADLTKAKDAFKKATTGEFGAPVAKAIQANETLAKELGEHASDIMSHTESAAKSTVSAAAKAGEDKLLSLFKGETKLKALAAEKKVAMSELKFFDKIRPGKTAIVAGIAAIGAYFIAGIGNNGPKDRAETIDNSRANGPATGRA